jgi:polysaccharide biosynthesis protein PslG
MQHLRQRLLVLATALLAGLPAVAQPVVVKYDRLVRPADAEFFHTPLGVGEDWPEESTTAEVYNADFRVLESAGIDLLRIAFGWDGIEEEKDRYDWLFWDDFVETAVDRYGLTLIPYICYTPRWNASRQEDEYFWRSPPVDYDEWGEFVFDLVSRYKDRIKTWELWNEPDIEWFWTGTPEEFARLLAVGAEAVRRADPEARVVMGGLAHKVDWLKWAFQYHGISPNVDIINIHFYNETWQEGPIEDIRDYILQVDEIVHRYGDGQPIWAAEIGYSTLRYGSYVSPGYSAYYDYEKSPEYAAVALARMMTLALSTDRLSAITWYRIKDLPHEEEVIGDNNNRYLGIVDVDYAPKPAKQALSFINRLYSRPMRSIDDEVTLERSIDSDVVVHVFERDDGDVIAAAWLRTRKIGRQNDVGEGMNRDDRRREVEVVIPRALAGTATLYDELGHASPHAAVRREGERTVLRMTLEGGKFYVLNINRDDAHGHH